MQDTATMKVIALAGSPNAGKSVLFNALTGLNQKVANYAGVTVEKKIGISKSKFGESILVIDLPGTYSLDPISIDEQIAVATLRGSVDKDSKLVDTFSQRPPDGVVVVLDATSLERSLNLVLEIQHLGLPMVMALNMMDLAEKRCLKINTKKLSSILKTPVIPLIATSNFGLEMLHESLQKILAQKSNVQTKESSSEKLPLDSSPAAVAKRFALVDDILSKVIETPSQADRWTWTMDRFALNPILGPVILLSVLLFMFQAIFSWAGPIQDMIETGFGMLGAGISTLLPEGLMRDLLVDGVVAGVGGVLVFLPQVVILFIMINLLEGSGYMTRAAFLLDRWMNAVGLQGRSFVPLLSSVACAIPGVMATRTIKNERDRLVTMMVAPLMTCSARLPVYTLLVAAFVPTSLVFGLINMQTLAMLGLFLIGIASAFAVALVTKITGSRRCSSPLMLELPSYRWPSLRYLSISVWTRVIAFLKRAGTIILASSVLIWALSTFPKAPEGFDRPAIEYSYAGRIGKAIEPLVAPIGFDWRIATSLVPGMAAREVMVSSLATVFAVEAADEGAQIEGLTERIKAQWPLATGLSLLAWYIFAPQCFSTIATVKRESGQWKWAIVMTTYMFALAWIASFFVYRLFR
jgi:ferrous iron transport protein B